MDDRITELEIRFMQQAKLLSELSDVIYAQQREIDRLGARLKDAERRLRAGSEDPEPPPDDSPPPHY